MMDDYSLIVLCKEGDEKAKLNLFERYRKFLVKKFHIFKRMNPLSSIELSDFCDEAFIWFLKAVEYVDLTVIYDRVSWHFLTPYSYYINNMMTDLLRKEQNYCPHSKDHIDYPFSLNSPAYSKEEDEKNSEELIDSIPYNDRIEEKVIEKEGCNLFLQTLSPLEKEIFGESQILSNGKIPNLDILANRFGISRAWMAKKIKSVREKFHIFILEYIY